MIEIVLMAPHPHVDNVSSQIIQKIATQCDVPYTYIEAFLVLRELGTVKHLKLHNLCHEQPISMLTLIIVIVVYIYCK
jgi:hypothetical protein